MTYKHSTSLNVRDPRDPSIPLLRIEFNDRQGRLSHIDYFAPAAKDAIKQIRDKWETEQAE